MPLNIIRQDIVNVSADAVVNSASGDLAMGGGVCGAIFKAAGQNQLAAVCKKLAPVNCGEAVITPAFALSAKYIIHVVTPVYDKDNEKESVHLLKRSYKNALKLAFANNCKSIAFPLLSSGLYAFPKEIAVEIATKAMENFLQTHDMEITLVLFDRDSFKISENLLGEIESYIDENYIDEHFVRRSFRNIPDDDYCVFEESIEAVQQTICLGEDKTLDEILQNIDRPFCELLMSIIDEKGFKDSDVYRRANIDRKLFSKIRLGKDIPRKRTVLALAVALELSIEETESFLKQAGYALAPSSKADLIVQYFIEKKKYNIYDINEVLYYYDLPLLGSF